MPYWDLKGRQALVTGSGGRVGAAIARALAREGCHLLIHCCSNEKGAREVAQDVEVRGCRATVVQADLRNRQDVESLAQSALKAGAGKVDIVVHSAANFERVSPDLLNAPAWDEALALNVTAPYLLTLGLETGLKAAKGIVLGIACVSAFRPWKNYLPYSVSKAALVHWVKGMALAWAPEVRVNGIAPGTVLPPSDYDEETVETLRKRTPLQRLGEADDIARAVVFLCQNDFITGQILAVDGGRSLE